MNDMIERVAKAICLVHNTDIKRYKNYISAARAAIEAMREPTLEMSEVGGEVDDIDDCYTIGRTTAKKCWQAMIDEALK